MTIAGCMGQKFQLFSFLVFSVFRKCSISFVFFDCSCSDQFAVLPAPGAPGATALRYTSGQVAAQLDHLRAHALGQLLHVSLPKGHPPSSPPVHFIHSGPSCCATGPSPRSRAPSAFQFLAFQLFKKNHSFRRNLDTIEVNIASSSPHSACKESDAFETTPQSSRSNSIHS